MTVKQMPSASDDTMRNIMILLSSHNSHNGGSSVRTTERNFCSYVRHGKPQSLFCETLKTTTKGLIYMKKLNIMDEYRLVINVNIKSATFYQINMHNNCLNFMVL